MDFCCGRWLGFTILLGCGADSEPAPATPRAVYLAALQGCDLASAGKLEGLPWFLHEAPDLVDCQVDCLNALVGECEQLESLACAGVLPGALRSCLAPCQERTCDDGQVVPASYLCDGMSFCSLATDESECDARTNKFACAGGGSIELGRACDMHVDCADGSDEPAGCAKLTCSTPASCSVETARECDSYVDCAGAEDESSCGADDCELSRCDGRADCDDGRDEAGCPAELCPRDLYCNDVVECPLGIDEIDCVTSPCPDAVYCDGVVECPNAEDEIDCAG